MASRTRASPERLHSSETNLPFHLRCTEGSFSEVIITEAKSFEPRMATRTASPLERLASNPTKLSFNSKLNEENACRK